MKPHILVIDGMNSLHRARSGFQGGEFPVVYNFFRQLRALIEMHAPTRVYFVREGRPVKRIAMFKEYKANRAVEVGTKKHDELQRFFGQCNIVHSMLEQNVPVSVVQHPDFEADDTIYNLIKRSSTAVPWTVCSNDSDFTQLLDEFEHVKLYNPMKKTYVEKPTYDYVQWKALRGDPSDNIPKVVGFSDKVAENVVCMAKNQNQSVQQVLLGDARCNVKSVVKASEQVEAFERNLELIKFHTWSDQEAEQMVSSSPVKSWDTVGAAFKEMGFQSMLKEGPWERFCATFDPLWG